MEITYRAKPECWRCGRTEAEHQESDYDAEGCCCFPLPVGGPNGEPIFIEDYYCGECSHTIKKCLVHEDDLGSHVQCPKCGASRDVDPTLTNNPVLKELFTNFEYTGGVDELPITFDLETVQSVFTGDGEQIPVGRVVRVIGMAWKGRTGDVLASWGSGDFDKDEEAIIWKVVCDSDEMFSVSWNQNMGIEQINYLGEKR